MYGMVELLLSCCCDKPQNQKPLTEGLGGIYNSRWVWVPYGGEAGQQTASMATGVEISRLQKQEAEKGNEK